MKLRRMIKQKARSALNGNRGRAVALILISLLVSVIINMVDAAALRLLGYEFTLQSLDIYTYSNDFFYSLPAMTVSVVTWIVRMVLVVPLGYGMLNWHLELSDRRKQGVMHIFWPYESKAALRGVMLSINIFVKMTLMGCLLLVLPIILTLMSNMPSINNELAMTLAVFGLILTVMALLLLWVFAQRFAIASILLCEKYQLTVHQAVKTSVRFTKGHRFELLRFELSFLPWILPLLAASGMMTFSLMYDYYSAMPFVWMMVFTVVAIATYLMLMPYYTMARVMYARYLYEHGVWQQNGMQPTATMENKPSDGFAVEQPAVQSDTAYEAVVPEPVTEEQPMPEIFGSTEHTKQPEISAGDGQLPLD